MSPENELQMRVEGPEVDRETRVHRYAVLSTERDLHFSVLPEATSEDEGWCVRIEGVPAPSIVHTRPWRSVDEARDAALEAVADILHLERVQREEMERSRT